MLDTEKFIDQLKQVAGSFDPSLCSGPTFDSIAQQIRSASDIMVDGTQDPAQTCNAISIGVGFEAKAARIGAVARKSRPRRIPALPDAFPDDRARGLVPPGLARDPALF